MTRGSRRSRRSAGIMSPVKAGRKNPALSRAARAELRENLRAHPGRVLVGWPACRSASAAHPAGEQREVDAFAGDRVDQSGGIADETPRGPAELEAAERLSVERRNRPRVRARDARRGRCRVVAIQSGVCSRRSSIVDARVGLRADADRQMIGSRKRPDVAGRRRR